MTVARGNEKGRVERSIRYIRDNFFKARQFADLNDLNEQARVWCEGPAMDRPWPEGDHLSVRQAFAVEQPSLMALPEHDYPVGERLVVDAGKTPYVRFDLNDYSIPHTHVRRTLTVVADHEWVRVLDGATVLATHPRCFDRHEQIEQPLHIKALVRDVPHPNAVRLALEAAREQRHQLPPIDTPLSERARLLDVTVRPHGLDLYDALHPGSTQADEDES